MRGLEIVDTDFAARDMSRDRQNGHTVALAIEQTVDQMQVAGATTAGANRKAAGEMSLRPGRESRGLFMPHVNPVN